MTKLIFITGGTRGIGRGLAECLVADGHSVVVTSRKQSFDAALRPMPRTTIEQQLDVSDEHSIRRLFDWLDTTGQRLDVLVNNAGVGVFEPFLKLTSDDFRNVMNVNVSGVFSCTQHAVKRMLAHEGGRIINVGSIVDKVPTPGNIAYGASKWALRGLSRTLSEELKDTNVRVTHASVGAVYTEIWQTREGFSESDMLSVDDVSRTLAHVASLPVTVRIDELDITPAKGIL